MSKDIYIKISHPNAVPWIHSLIQNSLANRSHSTTITFYEELSALDEALSHPLTLEEILGDQPKPAPAPVVANKKTTAKKAAPKKASSKRAKPAEKKGGLSEEDRNNPLICNDHPTYGGKYRPRQDCDWCWSIYKKLHVNDYPAKRREFERQMRASGAK